MRKHSRKIYYSAGLISIILLPLLCIIYLKNNDAFTRYGSISFETWDGKESSIRTKGIKSYLNSKKYVKVSLTGDNNSDLIKINNAEKSIIKLLLSKDSINGIQFHFGPKSEYWAFIRVVDILATEEAAFYVHYKNDIWFSNPKPIKQNNNFLPIPPLLTCGYRPIGQNELVIEWKKIIDIAKKYYLPLMVYCLMLFFTFKKLRT